jgi:hypothetical protein
MARRNLLKRLLLVAWQQTIRRYYERQQINSERGLQVFFCQSLISQFDAAKVPRRLFVEPTLTAGNSSSSPKPDVLICNRHRIIGVVELKYLPRANANYRKDLQTLEWCGSHADSIQIRNERYLGRQSASKYYSLANDAVLCWAGVFNRPIVLSLRGKVSEKIHSHFMELHAVTVPGGIPTIYSNYTPRSR